MKRLLTKENKRSIKEAFRGNAVFRTIDAAFKEQERRMETLKFSPEEIWVNCFIGFDGMLRKREEAGEMACSMWNDIFCELRDDADDDSRRYQTQELNTATSCIVYSIVACMMASEDWHLIRHAETLMSQIAGHSDLSSISQAFDQNIGDDFVAYIKEYVHRGRYLSQQFENPKNYADPINPVATAKDRTKAKEGVKKRLEFMRGVLPDGETQIMTATDWNTMVEAVEHLIENNVVRKQESKLRTSLPVAHLRYTFYLVFKNEGKCIRRQLWLDFLTETFAQMQDNRASLSKHFSDEPGDYGIYIRPKKRR